MGKKRERNQNPQPFVADDNTFVSRSRSKAPKHHQQEEKMISTGMSSKILKEALIQQREIQEEDDEARNPSHSAFAAVADQPPAYEEEDIDNFDVFSETESQIGGYDLKIDEEDERLLDAFLSDTVQQRTLADVIAARIKEKDAEVASEPRPEPRLDKHITELYKGVGKVLSRYTSGKIPKAFKHIPAMRHWEEILYLTEPEKWSPNAVYQATRIFASNLGVKQAERFYKFVLLPRIREDIRNNKRLHFSLYQSLKKSLYKPAAFNKGILLPLCESGSCTLREAVIIGSIIQKVSIPPLHSSVALLKLAEMDYCGTTSYFIKLLIEKKYALPYRVVDGLVGHFMRFLEDTRIMPVIWHQSLLAFVQRYKNELLKEDKINLNRLIERQRHILVTLEISRELNNSRNRGEKEEGSMQTYSPTSVIIKPLVEDKFDIPEVPMEED